MRLVRNQLKFSESPIEVIHNIFNTISANFVTAFLTIIDDRNNMLDSTRDLVLNYELFLANNTAATNTILNGVFNLLRNSENIEWVCRNIFRNIEVNFSGLYHDLGRLYDDVTANHGVISRQISNVIIILNRMYKGFREMMNTTGSSIINSIFESIQMTYGQISENERINRDTIIDTCNRIQTEIWNNLLNEFNMMRINFQTMDANDRLIQQGNTEIRNEIRNQENLFRSIQDTINRIPFETGELIRNMLNELVTFIKENSEVMKLKNEEYMYQGIGLILSEQQEQRKRFDEQNRGNNEASMNHHAIMMIKFDENSNNLNTSTSTISQSLNLNTEKVEYKIETKTAEITTSIEKVEDKIIEENEKTIKTVVQEEESTRRVITQSGGQVLANI
jgi:hypothetical protein